MSAKTAADISAEVDALLAEMGVLSEMSATFEDKGAAKTRAKGRAKANEADVFLSRSSKTK